MSLDSAKIPRVLAALAKVKLKLDACIKEHLSLEAQLGANTSAHAFSRVQLQLQRKKQELEDLEGKKGLLEQELSSAREGVKEKIQQLQKLLGDGGDMPSINQIIWRA
jgi:hypothetical protein